jgi:surface polysaccharide O-acyltransferase-like enzyme
MNYLIIILIAFLIEAFIQAVKPLWGNAKVGELSLTEVISMTFGMIVAVIGRLNLFADFVTPDSVFLLYVFYVITGLAMGRGASFVHDLQLKLRSNYGNGLPSIEDKPGDGDNGE